MIQKLTKSEFSEKIVGQKNSDSIKLMFDRNLDHFWMYENY